MLNENYNKLQKDLERYQLLVEQEEAKVQQATDTLDALVKYTETNTPQTIEEFATAYLNAFESHIKSKDTALSGELEVLTAELNSSKLHYNATKSVN